ncbi:MAG: DMT family transporter [Deferribacterales bacterium]
MIKGILIALISACAYATLPIFGKMGYEVGLSAVNMLAYRFTFGAAALALLLAFSKPKALVPSFRLLLKCAGLGIGLYMMQSFFFFKAVQYIPASTTSLILYIYPLVVLILSTVFLKIKFRMASLISIVLIMIGCCLVFYDAFQRELNLTGLIFALAAPITFGAYLTLSQVVLKNEKPTTVALYMMLLTGIGFTIINGGLPITTATSSQLMVGLGLGLIPAAIAILTLYISIEMIGATYVSVFSSIEPAVTLLLAGMLLGENIVIYQIYGVGLLMLGIIVPNMKLIKNR